MGKGGITWFRPEGCLYPITAANLAKTRNVVCVKTVANLTSYCWLLWLLNLQAFYDSFQPICVLGFGHISSAIQIQTPLSGSIRGYDENYLLKMDEPYSKFV